MASKENIKDMEISKEKIKKDMEMIHFASQEITDHTQTSIAIIVGLFGILLLFSDMNRSQVSNHMDFWKKGSIIILSLIYFGLIGFGLKSIIERQIFFVMKERLLRQHYPEYNDELKNI